MRTQPSFADTATAPSWQFPDVGLAIELTDSVCISWDGREVMHCTSAPTSQHDDLLSLFFSLPSNVVRAAQRRTEMCEALRARAESDPAATPQLKVCR